MYFVEYWEYEDEPTVAYFSFFEEAADFIKNKVETDSSRCVSDFRVIRETDVSKEIQDFILGETNV